MRITGCREKQQLISVSDKKNIYRSFIQMLFVFWIVVNDMFHDMSLVHQSLYQKPRCTLPSTPLGTTFGYVGIDYEYAIVTLNPDSFWMFDWGDGTNSSWLQLEQNQTSITETHHWDAGRHLSIPCEI